ncbi:MAG TPA: type II toxin-antitoxin system mRNA interferase toxin, RelE/StbE family [Candidatus Pacearchaeota archaeon]|nr:type II toxin-antitoxin system mRNA interferase toxin, RelE/StbE family [Candidatus Pacearchaeota archaeon]
MNYLISKNFKKQYKRLPLRMQEKLKNALLLFAQNEYNQILNNHNLNGKLKDYKSIDITGDYRAIFKVENGIAIFYFLGNHNNLYK